MNATTATTRTTKSEGSHTTNRRAAEGRQHQNNNGPFAWGFPVRQSIGRMLVEANGARFCKTTEVQYGWGSNRYFKQ